MLRGMSTDEVLPLLDRFVAGVTEAVAPLAVWAHGSLALGDYQAGRSDLDLLAVVATEPDPTRVERLHRDLDPEPLADKLHCSYLVLDEIADPTLRHLTWAHREIMRRPVTPVTRRELAAGGRTLAGAPPADLIPDVSDAVLADFVRADLAGFWRRATRHPARWLQDVWVDLGMVTVARAGVTLTEGRLITKREALDVLAELGAPADVCADIRQRRYDTPARLSPLARVRRGRRARRFIAATIDGVVAVSR